MNLGRVFAYDKPLYNATEHLQRVLKSETVIQILDDGFKIMKNRNNVDEDEIRKYIENIKRRD